MGKDTNKKRIHATVTPRLASFVTKLCCSGRFRSQSEAVRAALWLLKDKERLREVKLEALKEKIQKGLDSGPASPLDMEEVRKEARARFEENNQTEK